MTRPKHDVDGKREIATRLQGLIDDGFRSFYAFSAALSAKGLGAHKATVRGWIPPQERWKKGQVRPMDWKAVNLPDAIVLAKICDSFNWSADWILLGSFPPYRDRDRPNSELAHDLAQYLYRVLWDSYPDMGHARWILDPTKLLPRLKEAVLQDAAALLSDAQDRIEWHALWAILKEQPPSAARQVVEAFLKKAKLPNLQRNGLHLLTVTKVSAASPAPSPNP